MDRMGDNGGHRPAWWAELVAVPEQMAAQVAAWLPDATVEGYCRFLDRMYHYTLDSEARLRGAAALTGDVALRAFYLELADEEAPHFELARRDLAHFGREPSGRTPPEVAHFQAFWAGVDAQVAPAHLGALFALESVADHLAHAAVAALQRLELPPDRASFVMVHLKADEAHGDLCRRHCVRVGGVDHAALLKGARQAGAAWVEMHRCLAQEG